MQGVQKEDKMANNGRRLPRRKIHQRIGLLVGGHYSLVWAREIGEGGMLIESSTPMSIGQRVVVSIRIPGVLQGVIRGQVSYITEQTPSAEATQYGVQFENIEFDVKRKVRHFVASGSKKI